MPNKKETIALALLSDHTTSYSHGEDEPLGLTAQYSGGGLWGPNYKITQPLKMKFAIILIVENGTKRLLPLAVTVGMNRCYLSINLPPDWNLNSLLICRIPAIR